MKRFLCLCFIVLGALCGKGEEIDYDLVFVNGSDAKIVEEVMDFQNRNGGPRNVNSFPLKRGNSFGFEAGEYPVTMYVYDHAMGEKEAPPAGERWYITARDGAEGLELT